MLTDTTLDIQWERSSEYCGGFYFLCSIPNEIYDLSAEDIRFFKRYEVETELSLELTEHQPGIYCAKHDTLPHGIDELFLDVRGALNGICLFGKYLSIKRFFENARLMPKLGIIPFNNDTLLEIADSFRQIDKFQYEFIRDSAYHSPRSRFSGHIEGKEAQEFFHLTAQQYPQQFCLKMITGYIDMTSITTTTLLKNGVFYMHNIDRESFAANFALLNQIIPRKIECMIERHVFKTEEAKSENYIQINGTGLVYGIVPKSADITGFYEKLSKSERTIDCRIFQLKSLWLERLYRIFSYKTGAGLELAINPEIIQINMYSILSILPTLHIEYFMQKHLNASLKFYEV